MNVISKVKTFSFWQGAIRLSMVSGIIWAFRVDFSYSFSGIINLVLFGTPLSEQGNLAILRIFIGTVLLISIYIIFVYWLVHFVLPISHPSQKLPAFWRMLRFGVSRGVWHGPAIFVRNGEVIGKSDEVKKKRSGVAFLDLRSAMVLEKLQNEESEEVNEGMLARKGALFPLFKSKENPAQVRVVGPGLAFIRKNEHITGTVDLRIQSRSSKKTIFADTRDGIRVSASISARFTIGQPPDILDVYVADESIDKVFVIEWAKEAPAGVKIISKFKLELDEGDAEEIIRFFKAVSDPSAVRPYPLAEKYPYIFDEERVEQAVFSISNINDPNQPGIKKWSDWPQDVAAEKFRILLSEVPYMSLYTSDNPSKNPMKDFRQRMSLAVRNTGVLAYRIVKHREGIPLRAGEGHLENDLVFFPVQKFSRSDVLRDRGIKVLSAGFGELEPEDTRIFEQLRASWLSSKKREENIKAADYELEASRIINHARVRAQQSMNYHLTKLLEKQEHPREALAILIFQELEAAAANPKTRRLLPENTLNILNTIGQLLLQSQKESDGYGNERAFPQAEDE